MGRTRFLKQVLPENIENNPEAEFVLVDYSSEDGLEAWIRSDMWHHVESGRLVVYRVDGLRYFIHAHAKNIAHVHATGDILCNLDADNAAAKGFAQFLVDTFRANPNGYARPGIGGGRIALARDTFMRLGGYDESMVFGWGWEDNDLGDRLGRDLHYTHIPAIFNHRIEHDDLVRTELTASTDLSIGNDVHKTISQDNLSAQRMVANVNRRWGWWPKLRKNYQDSGS